jgi:hypothetical protein
MNVNQIDEEKTNENQSVSNYKSNFGNNSSPKFNKDGKFEESKMVFKNS